MRRMERSGNHRTFPMSRPRATRDECMAGVWGEASPQAPPEGAGGAKRKDGRGQGRERVLMYGDGPRRVGPVRMADPRLRMPGRVSSAARSLRSQGFYSAYE